MRSSGCKPNTENVLGQPAVASGESAEAGSSPMGARIRPDSTPRQGIASGLSCCSLARDGRAVRANHALVVGVVAAAAFAFVTRLAAVFLAAGFAFVDRVAVFGVAFLAAPAFAPPQPFIDLAAVFAAAGFAFVDRFAVVLVAVVVLAAFEFFAIYHGSSSEDVLFLIRLLRRHPDVSRRQPINLACEASNPHTRIALEYVRSANQLSCNGLATIIGHLLGSPNSRN